MNFDGRLDIDLRCHNNAVRGVSIASTRQRQLSGLLIGRKPSDTVSMVRRVHSVCSNAQGYAAITALENALNCQAPPDLDDARMFGVLTENAREHFLRIFLDWPRFMDLPPHHENAKAVLDWCRQTSKSCASSGDALAWQSSFELAPEVLDGCLTALAKLLHENVYGEDLPTWSRRADWSSLVAWFQSAQTVPAQLLNWVHKSDWAQTGEAAPSYLPPLSDRDVQEQLFGEDGDAFVARPTWQGLPRETSALSRQSAQPIVKTIKQKFGAGLMARLVARLCELSDIFGELQQTIKSLKTGRETKAPEHGCHCKHNTCQSGYGVGTIEAARGRLVHGARVEQGVVADYKILAPTEWNFHPLGSAKQALEHLTAPSLDMLRRQAELTITAIDPCVGYELRVV